MTVASKPQRRQSASLMIPTKETVLGSQSFSTVWDTYVELGDAAYRNGHEDVARMMLQAALREANQPVVESAQLTEVLLHMATVYHQQQRHKKAEVLLKRALETAEREAGNSDLSLCPILDLLGDVCALEGRLEKAERFHKRSLAIARRVFGRKDKRTVPGLLRMMSLYKMFGRLPESSIYRERAKEIDPLCLVNRIAG